MTTSEKKDFTPTVGLGCRSGGYLIYLLISFVLLTTELLTWWLTHTTTHTPDDLLARVGKKIEHHHSFQPNSSLEVEGQRPASLQAHAVGHWFRSTTFRGVIKNWLLRPGEVINTGWLAYIISAQTFGAYQTCDCMAKMWTGNRFLDFRRFVFSISQCPPCPLSPQENLFRKLRQMQSRILHLRRSIQLLAYSNRPLPSRPDCRPSIHCRRILYAIPLIDRRLFPGYARVTRGKGV